MNQPNRHFPPSRCGLTRFSVSIAVLGVAALLAAGPAWASDGTVPAEALDPELISFYEQEEIENVKAALIYLKKKNSDKKAAARFSPKFLATVAKALKKNKLSNLANVAGPAIALSDGREVVLQSDFMRLSELGAAIRARKNPENLEDYYALAYKLAPEWIRQLHPHPSVVFGEPAPVIVASLQPLLVDLSIVNRPPYIIGLHSPPSAATCQNELGYEDGTDQDPGTCAAYATDGIMRNVEFPLRDDMTCVRNQGRRGACVAFASVAAMETAVHVRNGNKITLSEQHAYWYGETTVGFNGRYTFGLNTVDYLNELETSSYQVPKEKVWNYNPSRSRDDQLGDIYPDSCVGYFGELCTDFAFQGDEIEVVVPLLGTFFVHPNPNPDAGAWTVDEATELGVDAWGLTFAKSCLDGEIPLVVAVDVTPSLQNPDSNGYVSFVAGEDVSGGHAMHVAGWVDNAELPAGAPAGAGGGYFVLKNSWGENSGDCGFYYVPYSYLLTYGRSLMSVSVD